MQLLRRLFFIQAFYYFELFVVHVPGAQNGWADAILHNNVSFFSLLQASLAVGQQATVSRPLCQLILEQQPDWTSPAWTQLFGTCFQQE